MKKVHPIIPGRRCLVKRILQAKMHFLAKGLIQVVHSHEDLKRDVSDWPEGFTLLLDVLGDAPRIALQKYTDGLYRTDPSALIHYDLRISLKNIAIAQKVLSGRMGFCRAMIENRLVAEGPSVYFTSLLRCLIKAQHILFRLPRDERLMIGKRNSVLGRLKVYQAMLFVKSSRKEDASVDTQVLRVFE